MERDDSMEASESSVEPSPYGTTQVVASDTHVSNSTSVPADAEFVQSMLRDASPGRLSRLRDFRLIAEGGVGRVQHAFDPVLGRHVAVKTLRPEFRDRKAFTQRLLREARATAQLEHPGIVPVYDIGYDDSAGVYFSMREVQGLTLRDVFDRLKAGDEACRERYSQSHLMSSFVRLCQAIAYAHSRGVIHRDLKPENVVIGDYGEVVILDWGLVRQIDPENGDADEGRVDINPVSGDAPNLTLDGVVSGTPRYMSPEQARGENGAVDERSDVFSLGILLYEILTLASPFAGRDTQEILRQVSRAEFVPPRRRMPRGHVSRDLDAICRKAMALRPEDRYASVHALIDDVFAHLDGRPLAARPVGAATWAWKWLRRHPLRSSMVGAGITAAALTLAVISGFQQMTYRSFLKRGMHHVGAGLNLQAEAYALAAAIAEEEACREEKTRPTPEERRLGQLLRGVEARAANHLELAESIMNAIPLRYRNRAPVRTALRRIYQGRVEYAVRTRQYDSLNRWVGLLRLAAAEAPLDAKPELLRRVWRAEAILRGNGTLAVRTEPSGAMLLLHSLEENPDTGIVHAVAPEDLGTAPADGIELQRGDYLLVARPPGGSQPVIHPLRIEHGTALTVTIDIPERIPDAMVYVPSGPFECGEFSRDSGSRPSVDLPSYFIRRTEVTFDEYRRFWESLPDTEQRERFMSRVAPVVSDVSLTPSWDADGVYLEGISGDTPVFGIAREAAAAYCRWLSRELGATVRLPSAEEWEKAARGTDGRIYPWGNAYHAEYAFTFENGKARERFRFAAPAGSFPVDRSVYGVLDMGGNVREWTASSFHAGDAFPQVRGASAFTTRRLLPAYQASDGSRFPGDIGFRYVIAAADWETRER